MGTSVNVADNSVTPQNFSNLKNGVNNCSGRFELNKQHFIWCSESI